MMDCSAKQVKWPENALIPRFAGEHEAPVVN